MNILSVFGKLVFIGSDRFLIHKVFSLITGSVLITLTWPK